MLNVRRLLGATLFAGTALAATPALADETDAPGSLTVTGYVQVVSDYRFRGISATGGDFALQGSVNINHASGLYAGTWASNLEQDAADVYGSTEIDFYVGYAREIVSGVTGDVNLAYYAYPAGSSGNANFFEANGSVSGALGPATAKLGVAYAWKQDALGGGDNLYVYTDLGAGIPNTPVSLNAHLGITDGALSPKLLTDAKALVASPNTGSGFDYSVGATFAISPKLSIGASYVGVDGRAIDNYSDDTIVGTLKLAF